MEANTIHRIGAAGEITAHLSVYQNSAWLCVTFAPSPATVSKRTTLDRIASSFPTNLLRLRDNSEDGCCYLCERLDFGIADAVCEAIEDARKTLNIAPDHVILLGNGKSATAARYFALRLHYGKVIAVSPIDQLGSTVAAEKAMWNRMVGTHNDRDMALSLLDHLTDGLEQQNTDTVIRVCRDTETLSSSDFVTLALFESFFMPITFKSWNDRSIAVSVDGSPKGDLCLDLLDESGERKAILKLHGGENELFVDDWNVYTPCLRYPAGGVNLPLQERLMGGKRFTVSEQSLRDEAGVLHYTLGLDGGNFRYHYRLFMADELILDSDETTSPTLDFPTPQNGNYQLDVIMTEQNTKSAKSAALHYRISVRSHEKTVRCTDSELSARLHRAVTGCRVSVSDGRLNVSLLTPDDRDPSLLFAVALLRERETVERRAYRFSTDASFQLKQSGSFRIRYAIKKDDVCVYGDSDPIDLYAVDIANGVPEHRVKLNRR